MTANTPNTIPSSAQPSAERSGGAPVRYHAGALPRAQAAQGAGPAAHRLHARARGHPDTKPPRVRRRDAAPRPQQPRHRRARLAAGRRPTRVGRALWAARRLLPLPRQQGGAPGPGRDHRAGRLRLARRRLRPLLRRLGCARCPPWIRSAGCGSSSSIGTATPSDGGRTRTAPRPRRS